LILAELKPALDAPELRLLPALELALKSPAGFLVSCAQTGVLAGIAFVVVEERRVGATMMN